MKKHGIFSLAILLAGTSYSYAQQGGGKQEAPAPNAPSAQAPSPGGGASGAAPGQVKQPGQSAKEVAPGQTKGDDKSAQGKAPGQVKPGEQTGDHSAGQNRKEDHERAEKDGSRVKGNPDGSPQKAGEQKAGEQKSGDKADKSGSTGEKGSDAAKEDASLKDVTPELKTKAKSAFTRHRVEPAKINISVNVGVAIPRDVRLYSVPEEIIVIVPAYRRYRYFIVGDQVCIVDPVTFEIVDIIVLA